MTTSDILIYIGIFVCAYILVYTQRLLFTPKPVYVPGTTAFKIMEDGWSKGFKVEQTLSELKVSGYVVDKDSIVEVWILMDEKMESFFKAQGRSSMDLLKWSSERIKERREIYDHL